MRFISSRQWAGGVAWLVFACLAALWLSAGAARADEPAADAAPAASTEPAAPAEESERSKAFDSRARVRIEAVPARAAVRPGDDLPVAVVFDHDPHWHIHPNAPVFPPEMGNTEGFIKAELEVAAKPGDALRANGAFLQWPAPTPIEVRFTGKPVKYGVFSGRVVVYLPVTVAADAKPGEAELTLLATYQACDERSCLAPVFQEPITLKVRVLAAGEAAATGPAEDVVLFAGFPADVWPKVHVAPDSTGSAPIAATPTPSAKKTSVVPFDVFGLKFEIDAGTFLGFALLLLVAALGGLLLNFTPCVLPVIPLKIMGLSRSAGSRGRMLALGGVMSLGVVAFWLGMAAVITLVTGFTSTNQLFQYPAFTIGVGVVIAVMALGMCGLFTVSLPQSVYLFNPKQETLGGSFAFGVMTAVLSTPCTAPLMGAAAAWAVKQTPTVTWMTFGSIGLGMASPYLLMSIFPALVQRLPRTGPGSELIKQVMGLFMLAAAAFFIGSGISGLLVVPPETPSRAYWWIVGALGAAGGAWLAYRAFRVLKSPAWRGAMVALGVVMIGVSILLAASLTRPGPKEWVGYTPARLAEARAAGKVVVVDFTAEWCLNCKALESSVLDTPRVLAALRDSRVVPMRVDITGNNPDGNRLLHEVGRVTIPTLVVFAPDGRQTLNVDAYTMDQVVQGIEEAMKGK
ncbi:MAG: thioredoxin family protein [Planctomycetota bacterium]|nr:thioredoxin family protein [Planctomycetota bacterium]